MNPFSRYLRRLPRRGPVLVEHKGNASDRRRRQEDADQFARAVGVLRADYSAPGAIRAAIVYGLNWTELLEAEKRVLALMAAADLVADPRLDGCDPDEYRTALAQLRTAVERCRRLKS